jgi:hypothetical protein
VESSLEKSSVISLAVVVTLSDLDDGNAGCGSSKVTVRKTLGLSVPFPSKVSPRRSRNGDSGCGELLE